MKPLIIVVGISLMTFNAIDESMIRQTNQKNNYCLEVRDGVSLVVYQGNALSGNTTLANGTLIKVDGTIIKKDGTKIVLGVNECADEEGNRMINDKIEKINEPKK